MRQLNISKQVTNRETASLDKYLHDIGKVELITAEEEVELARKIKSGDQAALEKLTKSNLRFVVSVAKQYQNQGLNLPDLINEGNLGLIKAAQRFDETRGFKFISYAVWWIRQSILQSLAEQSRMVRIPINRVSTISKIRQAADKFQSEKQRTPNDEEIAKTTGVKVKEVSEAFRISRPTYSLDAPFREGETNSLIDTIEDDKQNTPDAFLLDESLKEQINSVLDTLTDRERDVIKMYFGIDREYALTLNEIGDKLNLTRERIRQIKEKAIKRLAHKSRSELLRSYLG